MKKPPRKRPRRGNGAAARTKPAPAASPERIAFIKRRSEVLDAILADTNLSDATARVGAAVLQRIFGPGGYCGASIGELQQATATSRRTAQRAVAELVERGHLLREVGSGGSSTGTNRLRLPPAPAAPTKISPARRRQHAPDRGDHARP